MKVSELCRTCKYVTLLAHGMRCRKKMRVRYVNGKLVCAKYRISKRYEIDAVMG
jgi:hypothetical protein